VVRAASYLVGAYPPVAYPVGPVEASYLAAGLRADLAAASVVASSAVVAVASAAVVAVVAVAQFFASCA